ncbi:hypothetical protein BUALT_Bualt18G0112100 [Buddleja alternifolia]|uniref:Protein NUCLEAR FUSION DEFECTIVE 6, chloroplastic/mitochondrial-like n=1 Tax=Buddleja alternifolia TaxID=168488 RepID=A0AAV6WC63_9LAMI|nr:hypothetical protein BUALT_Bualt18G0112100 [Buddleja alternifolia]
MASVAARSILRSAATFSRSSTARLAAGVKPTAAPSPFRISSQKPLSARIFRSPVELSSVNVVSMLPYHTATASAVLTSMLSVAPRSIWSIEGSGPPTKPTKPTKPGEPTHGAQVAAGRCRSLHWPTPNKACRPRTPTFKHMIRACRVLPGGIEPLTFGIRGNLCHLIPPIAA